ncbi:MAG: ATP-binding protein, partial [Anaerolineae bacterium]|nr:ATP-binding protein [Anaerolineae bacterium]
MSHPFGDLLSQHLHRKHGLSQSKLAAGILQAPAIITLMCKGERLTGPQARERVLAIIGWLHAQDVLSKPHEANALLLAAGLAPLRNSEPTEANILSQLNGSFASARSAQSAPSTTVSSEFALVGRHAEWQTLRAAWQTATQGKAQVAAIAGEAGIGKTRLAEELMTHVHRQGYSVARTRAYALEGRLAYAPVA